MNLADATFIVRNEATAYPELAALTQSAYDELIAGNEVPYTVQASEGTFDPLTAPFGQLREHELRDRGQHTAQQWR
jgi:hypothetical protein